MGPFIVALLLGLLGKTVTACPDGHTWCSYEGGVCHFEGAAKVAYGSNSAYVYLTSESGAVECNNGVFGNPSPFTFKECCYQRAESTQSSHAKHVDLETMAYECTSDADCDTREYCNDNNECKEVPTPCYDSDECRGKQVCDMRRFQCVDPTPAPTQAGCCYGDSYKANDKCAAAFTEEKCAGKGCHWLITDDPDDCLLTTTTEEPGCCAGYDAKGNERCLTKLSQDKCENSNKCFWKSGADADCTFVATTTTPAPGCCFGNPDTAYSERWENVCRVFQFAAECLLLEDTEGEKRCAWEELGAYEDCEQLWPTTTSTPTDAPGCCYGDSYKMNDKCGRATERTKCESKGCHWLWTDDPEDCVLTSTSTTTTTTTTTTAEPGCCRGNTVKSNAACNEKDEKDKCERSGKCEWIKDGSLDDHCMVVTTDEPTTTEAPGCCYGHPWEMTRCEKADNARRCGDLGCHWLETDNPEDCIVTTSSTTTPAPGCCRGSSYKAQAKCEGMLDQANCERRDCEWLETEDPNDCVITTTTTTTTTTTPAPGCCYGDSFKSNDKCMKATEQERCVSKGCYWRETEDPSDCEMTTTTEEPGCCSSDDRRKFEVCNAKETREKCERGNSCYFISGVDAVCEPQPTTTTTTEAPGCCYGKAWEMRRCEKADSMQRCFDLDCHWLETDNADDCLVTTTTTTTEAPGCCMGSTYKAQPKCSIPGDRETCESKNCIWVETEDPNDCVLTTTTTTTTTTTPAPGCCKGTSFKAMAKCSGHDNEHSCERRSACSWIVTDDPDDCLITTTTTTLAPGCCKGLSFAAHSKCEPIEDRFACARKNKCEWIETDDEDDCKVTTTTTTEEPGCCYQNPDAAYSKRWSENCKQYTDERWCRMWSNGDGVEQCQWQPLGAYEDCEQLWPTTTTTTQAPGCCRGKSFKAHASCEGIEEAMDCLRKAKCEWVSTDEPDDCKVTTTSTTTTTEEPGCCAGDSMMSADKCIVKETQARCERSSRCTWISGENADCTFTPTTTTEEPGCCAGDSLKSNDKCIVKETRNRCERSARCEWRSGEDADCTFTTTTTTPAPGCCYGNPDAIYSKKWQETCTAYATERECLKLTNGDGSRRCAWEELGDAYDCSMLWPTTTTTTEEPGCCKGDTYRANAKCSIPQDQTRCEKQGCEWLVTDDPDDCVMTTTSTTTTTEAPGCCAGDSAKTSDRCNAKLSADKCTRSSSCHWIVTDDFDDCAPPTTTEEAGCCYGNPDAQYSKKWQETCVGFYTERECLSLTNGDGSKRCHWETLIDAYDCSMLWPTTTTTTEAPGCCASTTFRGHAKCIAAVSHEHCDRMNNCFWIETDDESDCDMTTTSTTTTTEEPGCCKGDSSKTNARCNAKMTVDRCEMLSSCHWITGEEANCEWDETTTEAPGCCYVNPATGYSARWQAACVEFFSERDCVKLENSDGAKRCVWEPTGDYADCSQLWPTTSTTTEAPGCCSGASYRGHDKCVASQNQAHCMRMNNCFWVETDDPNDCVLTTTSTTTTTTTEEPGCCAGDSLKSTAKCNARASRIQCEKMSSCRWVVTDDFADCDWTATTTEEAGCCYANPANGYSARWVAACAAFYSSRDCVMLMNDDGVPRCAWETTDGVYDCSQLWPTTTIESGCCRGGYGSSFETQTKCAGLGDESACARKNCEWIVTDDVRECEVTSTTEEPGCCAGATKQATDKCAAKQGRAQCERMDKCVFVSGVDADCSWPTTTSEPWIMEKDEKHVNVAARDAGFLPPPDKSETALMKKVGVEEEGEGVAVSLATVLMVAAAVVVVYKLSACWSASRGSASKLEMAERSQAQYQAV